jgi:hypothetical protein
MSALPPKADIHQRDWNVRFVPKAEVAAIKSVELIVQPDAHDVVGEMGADQDRAQKRIVERVIRGAKVHVKIFDFPSDMSVRHSALYSAADRPACLCNGSLKTLARRKGHRQYSTIRDTDGPCAWGDISSARSIK